MITERFVYCDKYSTLADKKLGADKDDASYYYIGNPSAIILGEPDISYNSIVFIADTNQMLAQGHLLFGSGGIDALKYDADMKVVASALTELSERLDAMQTDVDYIPTMQEVTANALNNLNERVDAVQSSVGYIPTMQKLTQAQYDALASKDSQTLYLIVDA